MTASASRPARAASSDALERIHRSFDALTPELRRAARWIADHPGEAGLLSMRQQAKSAGVSAPTMVRLARALGFGDYTTFRRPFQEALAGRSIDFGRRATALQSAPEGARLARLAESLGRSQVEDVQSVLQLNTHSQIEAVVDAISGARRVGFLGVRASFAVAYHFRYAYNLIARNGVLFDGLAGTVLDQADALGRGDALVAISQAPYSAPTVEAVDAAAARGVTIIALTDSVVSPLARRAKHALRFRADSVSFFHSMLAPMALVELLLARLVAKGGKAVLKRLDEVERRLADHHAYWRAGRPRLQA
jgi:DNA-binding MurR/RpiR family transcriptional regulator